MPPRIPISSCLRAAQGSTSSQFTLPLRPFSSSVLLQSRQTDQTKKRVSRDPYVVAQRNRKKAANLSRRSDLEEARIASLGNPVRGATTPFVESFETGKPSAPGDGEKTPKESPHLNYAFDPDTVERQLARSQKLAIPLNEIERSKDRETYMRSITNSYVKPTIETEVTAGQITEQNKQDHARAVEAISRITALENGSSKDRMRVNIARCVETFGRHETDKIFPPRAPTMRVVMDKEVHPIRPETNVEAAKKRIGPDTGSSEVQIAILTAKIKTVADFLETRGKGDKHNKRNLRLLVHRRQKLLQYLRRKERGGPRWQHCIETLGLTEGTWRGEISL